LGVRLDDSLSGRRHAFGQSQAPLSDFRFELFGWR
jgi:hypothetical protein